MAWIKLGSIKGPAGETGPQGPAASTAQTFLAAHPVGSLYMESKGKNQVHLWGNVGHAGQPERLYMGKDGLNGDSDR